MKKQIPTTAISGIKTVLTAVFLMLLCIPGLVAQTPARFHNEAADTTRLTEMLVGCLRENLPTPGDRVAFFGRKFEGTPYGAHTLENHEGEDGGHVERLTVNIDSVDCTTFVETVAALAFTAGEHRSSWRDFLYNLQRLRYRNGEVDGYASRLHYICDWAVDNVHRGNITDATGTFPRYSYIVRTIDFMSSNREAYPALASDSAAYAKIRSVESGYRRHRFPYVKTIDLGGKETRKAFRNGDILAFVTNMKNLDVTHMGIVVKDESTGWEPYVLHASSSHGKVEVSADPLDRFVKRNRSWSGVRVFRLTE